MKSKLLLVLTILFSLSLTGCFNEKSSPFYDSEWVMQNLDDNAELYYHHLFLMPGHKVMLRVSYADSSNIIVWNGTYKINSQKIKFSFTSCDSEILERGVLYRDMNPAKTDTGYSQSFGSEMKRSDADVTCGIYNVNVNSS